MRADTKERKIRDDDLPSVGLGVGENEGPDGANVGKAVGTNVGNCVGNGVGLNVCAVTSNVLIIKTQRNTKNVVIIETACFLVIFS